MYSQVSQFRVTSRKKGLEGSGVQRAWFCHFSVSVRLPLQRHKHGVVRAMTNAQGKVQGGGLNTYFAFVSSFISGIRLCKVRTATIQYL